MNRVVGLVFLLVGVVLLYRGWQAHAAVTATAGTVPAGTAESASIWMLGLGAVAAVWGLFALMRRRVA
jgi:hypothetical protein